MVEAPSGYVTGNWNAARAPQAWTPKQPPRPAPPAKPEISYDICLDWGRHPVSVKRRTCRICRAPAWMLDEDNRPCHKTCAERLLVEQLGEAGARAHIHATYSPRRKRRDGA